MKCKRKISVLQKFTGSALYKVKKNILHNPSKKIKTEFSAYHWKICHPVLLCKCQMYFTLIFKLIPSGEYFAKVSKQYNDKRVLYYIKKQRRYFFLKNSTVFFIDVATIIYPSLFWFSLTNMSVDWSFIG